LDGCLLDAHFTRLVYKRILDKPVTYHDMASVDVQFYRSLCWLLENKLEGIDLSLTFSVDKENFGAYEEIEVCSYKNDPLPSLIANPCYQNCVFMHFPSGAPPQLSFSLVCVITTKFPMRTL
jgi:hypothetical protein